MSTTTTSQQEGLAEISKDGPPEPVNFGPDESGGYVTPYKFTVVYHPESLFESAVAFLCDQAQLIPLAATTDYSVVAESCEHPSPEVLIFGTEFSREDLLKFFDRGCQFIHIFTYNKESAEKYIDTPEGEVPRPFDLRTVTFNVDTLYEHIVLIQGLLPIYILEHITCAAFPTYTSIIGDKEVNNTTGNYLCKALSFANKPFGEIILTWCSTYKGFDLVRAHVVKGQTIVEEHERLASKRLEQGIHFHLEFRRPGETSDDELVTSHLTYAVPGGEFVNNMIMLAPVHPLVVKPNCDFVMFYSLEQHRVNNIVYPGWRITLVAVGKEAPNALEVLRGFVSDTVGGSYGVASAWIPTGGAGKALPFIYPDPVCDE